TPIEMKFGSNGEKVTKPFEGLVPQMQRLYEETESEFTRNRIRSFMTREPCKVCRGARLRPEILAVTISAAIPSKNATPARTEGARSESFKVTQRDPSTFARDDQLRELNIHQFTELTVEEAAQFISKIALS